MGRIGGQYLEHWNMFCLEHRENNIIVIWQKFAKNAKRSVNNKEEERETRLFYVHNISPPPSLLHLALSFL